MPDLVVRHIDNVMAERIKTLAKDRRWSINDVVLHALKHGLGLAEGAQPFAETMLDTDTVVLSGHWDAAERAAFHEAVQALSVAPSSQLAAPAEDTFGEATKPPAMDRR
jgi:tellurite resistance protein